MNASPFSHPSNEDARRISREAAAWVIRRDHGLTAAEQDAFFQWLAADPRHGEWIFRHQQTWENFNLLAEWNPEHSDEPNPDLLARPVQRTPTIRWVWIGSLAAACLALASWWKNPLTHPAEGKVPLALSAQSYERRVLADGSTVDLNHDTRIEVAYSSTERRVKLEKGEASFTVVKNQTRPFVVRVAGIDVRAVGTAFNIRLGEKQIHVLVTEGRVRVDDATDGASMLAVDATGQAPMLAANQQVTIPLALPAPAPVLAATSEDIARQLAWRPEVLEFNSTPLSEVVAAFNRHNRLQLSVADPALLGLPIVASFRSDNVEGFVRLLEVTAGVRVARTGDAITLHAGQ
ncbi:MAG: FecR domain-containing protein [Opitutaceae bacterium]|nr:FecR domain-containing protein [Opitutaceae bacterium]